MAHDLTDASPGSPARLPRRALLKALAAGGATSAVFARALSVLAADKPEVTKEMIRQAEWISGITLDEEKRNLMVEDMGETLEAYARIRAVEIDNGVPPAVAFDPAPLATPAEGGRGEVRAREAASPTRPAADEDLAFAPVADLAPLIRSRQISSVELTRLYLERIDRYDPMLRCVITRTDDLALEQAERADREIAEGNYRGPLHGIPWGAKDLLAVPGYRTTWGAKPYRDQVRSEKATVVARLEEAGAVLLAKTSVGALAWGDVWFDAMTRNPWKTEQGSSGSSAGSASGAAAGLFGFAIGTETLGSIVSPCTRCGTSGLRPTFGRISRHGAMALAWTMDKIGPIARSVEDLALVLGAVHGEDGLDPSCVTRPFSWPPVRDVRALRVGYVKGLFEEDRSADAEGEEMKARIREWQEIDRRALRVLEEIGLALVPIDLPKTYPVDALSFILSAEAAAAFDHLTRSGRDAELVRQERNAWPNVLRQAQFIPAVEYLRANRIRRLVMQEMEELMRRVDLYVSPTYAGGNLLLTNLTGQPQVVVPHGFRESDGTPVSLTFTGSLFGEAEILAVARAFQEATDHHRRRPGIRPPLEEKEPGPA